MKRRDFIKTTVGGMAALAVGSNLPWLQKPAYADHITSLNIIITDTLKEMVTFNAVSPDADPYNGMCYFWIYHVTAVLSDGRVVEIPPDCPGPTIYATDGDTINLSITNALDEPHSLVIQGMFNSGPIPPDGIPRLFSFRARRPGSYLYFDTLNQPVNWAMGLHGAFIVMPSGPAPGHKWTPYRASDVTPEVQQLFDDLGTADHWPGLAWEEGNPATLTPPFRQYVWLTHQASPILFRDVGSLPPGEIMPPHIFRNRFLSDAFTRNNFYLVGASDLPQYFTINGQSGHFGHNNPVNVPMARVGEPCVIRVMNAGLMSHSMHLHANHYYVLAVDRVVQGAPVGEGADNASLLRPGVIWVDTMTLNSIGRPSRQYDMLVPYMRPPDIPNTRGIGRGGCPDPGITTSNGGNTYPPLEEFGVRMPDITRTALSSIDGVTPVPIGVRQSPLCYPMHDHSEATQTAQGGNYNCGLVGGMFFIGDQNVALDPANVTEVLPGGATLVGPPLPPQTFPMDEDFAHMIFAPHPDALNTGTARLVYGVDQARADGIMPASRDSELESQADRPDFPPPFVEPAPSV